METFEVKKAIEQSDDPEILKQTLFALLGKIDFLESRLMALGGGRTGKKGE